jgi:hypothetical protein
VRFVNFVEVAELEKIEESGTDPSIELVRGQIERLHREGFETALHLHPQWYNAQNVDGEWRLDYTEYNLCTLPRPRIVEIVTRGLEYLRYAIGDSAYTPLAFRAGNWLFQPTGTAAEVLGQEGLRIDSSAFKGGLQRQHHLDYRPALKNGYFWKFSSSVNDPDPTGTWLEVPIHTEMVPLWRMATSKRVASGNAFGGANRTLSEKIDRLSDFMRVRYPLKLDFCRMNLRELVAMMKPVIEEERRAPASYRPIVSIGHSKDLVDMETVESFLAFLRSEGIPVVTFTHVCSRLSAMTGGRNATQADGAGVSQRAYLAPP